MGAVSKLIIAGLLFLGVGLCIYGYLAQKLISISILGVLAVSAVCAGVFIYFSLFDPDR